MQKHLKASSTVLALALAPMLAFSEAAFAKKGGEGGGDPSGRGGQADSAASHSAGRSEASPGHTGSAPGSAGTTSGPSGATPAMGAQPPGLAGTAPGLAGATPGQSRRSLDGNVSATVSSRTTGRVAGLSQDVTGSVDASVARQANFGGLISSLNHAEIQARQIGSLTTIGEVTFVDASSLTRGARAKALDNALSRARVSDLRAALSGNAAVSSVLAANNVALDDVISVSVMADGNLVVYTR
ncbi:hypothetical protein [Microvirga sp. G4-2]|uniref:hypothetical protein n=1 Tax=Microvirga sp. G4-2 TaxID=3434467 RepID=UPI0040447B18